jgi:hypothetical protein
MVIVTTPHYQVYAKKGKVQTHGTGQTIKITAFDGAVKGVDD